jgi:hypothetical protein
VHAPLAALIQDQGGAELESGGVLHPETTRRLLSGARVQVVIEDDEGTALGMGRLSGEPSAAILRQLRYRDRECRCPGCGARRFTQAHHVRWWRHGGRTDLDNLVLVAASITSSCTSSDGRSDSKADPSGGSDPTGILTGQARIRPRGPSVDNLHSLSR